MQQDPWKSEWRSRLQLLFMLVALMITPLFLDTPVTGEHVVACSGEVPVHADV